MKPLEGIINKALEEKAERLRQSEEYRDRYLKMGDPQIVVDFLQTTPSYAPLRENQWVVEIIEEWWREGKHDLLKKLFSLSRGEKKGARETFNIHRLSALEVDALVSQEKLSRSKAFEKVAGLKPFGGWDTVQKAYYDKDEERRMYQTHIEETDVFYMLTIYNTVIQIHGVDLFGEYTLTIRKDSSKDDTVTIKAKGVSLVDEDFQRLQTLLSGVDPHKSDG
ncbi:MAG: hypothetical protein C0399_03445 [Syntrophus sp. (in: bacteria)]|nr:hypothetical protein [Syntrophus sp. (in: bacteria)]